jgi:hypothetical protein
LCVDPAADRSADAQSENACRRKGAAIIPRLRERCVVSTLPERAAVDVRGAAQSQPGRPCSGNPRAIMVSERIREHAGPRVAPRSLCVD